MATFILYPDHKSTVIYRLKLQRFDLLTCCRFVAGVRFLMCICCTTCCGFALNFRLVVDLLYYSLLYNKSTTNWSKWSLGYGPFRHLKRYATSCCHSSYCNRYWEAECDKISMSISTNSPRSKWHFRWHFSYWFIRSVMRVPTYLCRKFFLRSS